MIKKVLFCQSFVLENEELTNEILIWPVYLENFLKSKINNLTFDILYLPVEQKKGAIHINALNEVERFHSQMDNLISNLKFEIDNETLICVSGTTSHHFLSSKLICEYFQKYFPSSIIIFGGAHASACSNDFYYQDSPVDFIIQGEGELSLYNLIKDNPHKHNFPIIFPNNPILDLNALPPIDFSIFDKYINFFDHLSISLSRGCPFNCNFCMEKSLSKNNRNIKKWRVYAPKRAIQEVENMVRYGFERKMKEYGFYDPIFGLNKKWLEKFLELYNFQDISYAWIETRLDILNENLIQKLQSKKFYLMYGLESYSKRMLSIMNKTTNPKEYLEKFEKVYQIHKKLENFYMLNVLFNHPGETKESYHKTFNRLEEMIDHDDLDTTYLNIRFYHHFPGTKVYNQFEYFKEKYGSYSYFPGWWKREEFLKNGPYCVRPSFNLSLMESIDLYTDLYKNLEIVNLGKIKKNKPLNLFQRALMIKKELKGLEQKRETRRNFIREKGIESISI